MELPHVGGQVLLSPRQEDVGVPTTRTLSDEAGQGQVALLDGSLKVTKWAVPCDVDVDCFGHVCVSIVVIVLLYNYEKSGL